VTESTAAPTPPVSPEHFRAVLGHFCSGITVVTATDAHGPAGLTAQSFASLSLDPPLVLVCPAKNSTSWPRIEAAGSFCINVLSEDQEELCRGFAARGADKFAGVGYGPAPHTGAPLLAGALAWIDCNLETVYDGGDHIIAVGRVLDLGSRDSGRPLLFYRGGYGRFEI
jgi:3-hydroxy-9,10-secoandrosta-1,3,5(10)-triene-9,17-dione monooxygenase reductase component